MAWIRYYIRLRNALAAVAVLAHAGWGDTRTPGMHGTGLPALAFCVAAMVRRCTAATGE